MKIGILGTGKMGTAVGKRLAAAGHSVVFGSRFPAENAVRFAGSKDISVLPYTEAAIQSDLSIVAVPWAVATDLVASLEKALAGKVIVDLTNPASADFSQLVLGGSDSAAEQIARAAPESTVIKAFNGITADNFPTPDFSGEPAQMLYCGDDEEGKRAVRELIACCGYQPLDCGALSNARYLEAMAMLWIQLAFWEDWGTAFSFRVTGSASGEARSRSSSSPAR